MIELTQPKVSKLSRRALLLAAGSAVPAFGRKNSSRLAVEGYIFQQYAARQKKPLSAVLEEVFTMSRKAGFRNIELNSTFFATEIRERTFALVRQNGFSMPSVYVGGGMHTPEMAAATTAQALEIAGLCKPFGCRAVVNNPSPKPGQAAKSDAELTSQASALNTFGGVLKRRGYELRIHHHTPELANDAREWRHILHHTDPALVHLCVDLDWVHQGSFVPLDLLREAGRRVAEIHVRNAKNKLWLESLEDGDVDYREIAAYLRREKLRPLIIVELAYREQTVVTRPLGEDLRHSRVYAESVFTGLL